MKGTRKRKQAGRQDQDSPIRPRRSYPGIFLNLVSNRSGFLPQSESLAVRRRVGASFAALTPQPAAHPAPDNVEREFRLQSCFSEPHPRTRLRGC